MWCANCQADVAAEVTTDNRTIRCASCGREIGTSRGASTRTSAHDARQLLERWSSKPLLDPFGTNHTAAPQPEASAPALHGPHLKPEHVPSPNDTSAAEPSVRIDSPHALEAKRPTEPKNTRSSQPEEATTDREGDWYYDQSSEVRHSLHSRKHVGPREPHFDVQAAIGREESQTTNWTSIFGQLLAYGGVGMLTVGTTLVLWGYFGGPENYAPTGWLVTTAGQMLLFLGVVTLVSGGMEQTTEEVARKIDTLGDKILRIEQAAHGHTLRGPSIPAEHFADDGAPAQQGRRARTHSDV